MPEAGGSVAVKSCLDVVVDEATEADESDEDEYSVEAYDGEYCRVRSASVRGQFNDQMQQRVDRPSALSAYVVSSKYPAYCSPDIGRGPLGKGASEPCEDAEDQVGAKKGGGSSAIR
jgi:hypothetical protein